MCRPRQRLHVAIGHGRAHRGDLVLAVLEERVDQLVDEVHLAARHLDEVREDGRVDRIGGHGAELDTPAGVEASDPAAPVPSGDGAA